MRRQTPNFLLQPTIAKNSLDIAASILNMRRPITLQRSHCPNTIPHNERRKPIGALPIGARMIAMLIAAAILWFITVIIPTAICRGIGYLSRLPERPQYSYDSWRDACFNDDEIENEEDTERETADSRSVPQVYYEDDKNFVFPRIKVK